MAAFGSSDLGIVVAEWRDSKLNILCEASVNRPTVTQSIKLVQSLLPRYGGVKKILCDSSQPGFIRELNERYHDPYPNYHLLDTQLQDRLIHTTVPLVVTN